VWAGHVSKICNDAATGECQKPAQGTNESYRLKNESSRLIFNPGSLMIHGNNKKD
jgi:hypothetical protein